MGYNIDMNDVRSIDEIKAQYPNSWVALVNWTIENQALVRGVVACACTTIQDRSDNAIKLVEEGYRPYWFFTGEEEGVEVLWQK